MWYYWKYLSEQYFMEFFHKIWTFDVEHIDFKIIFITTN
jgi:hypothetical protein